MSPNISFLFFFYQKLVSIGIAQKIKGISFRNKLLSAWYLINNISLFQTIFHSSRFCRLVSIGIAQKIKGTCFRNNLLKTFCGCSQLYVLKSSFQIKEIVPWQLIWEREYLPALMASYSYVPLGWKIILGP